MRSWRDIPLVSGAEPQFGHAHELQHDPLQLFLRASREGRTIVRMRFGPSIPFFLAVDPECIAGVLMTHAGKFIKPKMDAWRELLGDGLITLEGQRWLDERRRVRPAFSQQRLHALQGAMIENADRQFQCWGEAFVVDMFDEMKAVTLSVAMRTFFSASIPKDITKVTRALTAVLEYIQHREGAPPGSPVDPALTQRFDAAVTDLKSVVVDVMNAHGPGRSDLLTMLLEHQDFKDSTLSMDQVRDEVLTHLVAGYESTATSLAWTVWLVSQHPRAEARLRDEIAAQIGARPPCADDMEHMPYARAIYQEALRLFPPSWSMLRASTEAVEIGGYELPKGAYVFACQYSAHRNSAFFSEPESFLPERWLDGLEDRLPRFAYFPFGGGPRVCIGQRMATLEAFLVLTRLFQTYQVALDPERPTSHAVRITLQPASGMSMRVTRRTGFEPQPLM